ncbi:DUF4856 domain-containing protein [Patiriisocius hiemis]|uniref:DUF4856 domain-containing protein n=1 Tax=Patiriisocius hiemis TaxID=3075604 RepID=A0ABU2YBT9_9FLAO|nr:DUF4856 domain-containing protein [Constantimarinum sp. W242]MDT0554695.1 DUF4856 domain-containing protein [Constantimarinum sp. W242]
MKKILLFLAVPTLFLTSCSSDDDNSDDINQVEAPLTYTFTRNGESTVSFSGQTTRIAMSEETVSAFNDFGVSTETSLLNMFNHQEGANDFSDTELNASDKSMRSKTAASRDYFSANTSEAALIKETFDGYISTQINEVYPNEMTNASPGVAGQIADGSSTRYVTGKGLEMNQTFAKGLIGALMVDQMLNNYLSTSVLDEATNVSDNDNDIPAEGKVYTTMEHKWDEAYGYLFGASTDTANPITTVGDDDSFLNKYLGRVEGDTDFAGIAQEVYDALKLGRAAIVAKNYEVRDEQAAIVRQKISEVIAIRAIYYLQQGKNAVQNGDMGAAFHDLSEGYGFVYSLRFTRNPNTNEPFFTRTEVDSYISQLMNDGANGLWDVTPATLDSISEAIAAKFDFTVAQAGSTN